MHFRCMESCYWHLIEERFCFDESIALYEEPESEKNNNMFDNMAFYDSVSVIAGRAIVTIDQLPDKPIMEQPTRRLTWQEQILQNETRPPHLIRSVPSMIEEEKSIEDLTTQNLEQEAEAAIKKKSASADELREEPNLLDKIAPVSKSTNSLQPPEVKLRKKSLRERRMSKSLYLKLDLPPKELPIIRQNSMPKFYLDTPQPTDSTFYQSQPSSLVSPVTNRGFTYDLYSVVQIEKSKAHQPAPTTPVPIHRESSRLALIKERMKLKKSKSTVSTSTMIPYTNHM